MGNSISKIEQEIFDTGLSDVSSVFLNIENCIKDRLADFQLGNITKEELYSFINSKLPIKNITLVLLMVDMILYRFESIDLRLKNSILS